MKLPMHEINPELDGFVVNFSHLRFKFNFVDSETDALETQLTSDVNAAKLHVHGHDLHSSDTPVGKQKIKLKCSKLEDVFIAMLLV